MFIKDMKKFRFIREGKKEESTEREHISIKDAKTITWEIQGASKRVNSVIKYPGNIR